MAGETKLFNDFILKDRQGRYLSTDTYQLVFLSNTYASIDTNVTDPDLSDYTVSSGGNVAASYTLSSTTFTRSGTVFTFDAANIPTIGRDANNPTDLRTALIICSTKGNEAIQVFDMTADGSTALDLVNNDFEFTFGSAGINRSPNNSAS